MPGAGSQQTQEVKDEVIRLYLDGEDITYLGDKLEPIKHYRVVKRIINEYEAEQCSEFIEECVKKALAGDWTPLGRHGIKNIAKKVIIEEDIVASKYVIDKMKGKKPQDDDNIGEVFGVDEDNDRKNI